MILLMKFILLRILPGKVEAFHNTKNIVNKTSMEVCVDSVQSAINAENGGAKRIELCCNLLEGGTTPSIGLLKVIKCNISLPVFVMIRPRGGDFLYTDSEFEVMIEDCKQLIDAGADGIVCGILTKQGEVDVPRCKKLLDIIKPLPVTFHRAFDMVPDQGAALEVLINLGFNRILTSGGRSDIVQGASRLKELVNKAGKRIIIMPGGGVNEDNLAEMLQVTGTREFHGSARAHVASRMEYYNSCVSMGGAGDEYGYMVANLGRVKRLTTIAQQFCAE